MDATRFDAIAQAMANGENRRGVVRLLAGSALGSLVLAGAGGAEAKKGGKGKGKGQKKKVEVCHNGVTIKISKKAKKKHLKHGDTIGACDGGTTTTPPPPDHCKDAVKNEGESDIDCGGTCPRCTDGKTCSVREDCRSGFCKTGVCTSCVDGATDCGKEPGGTNCFCRDSLDFPGTRVCTNQLGRTLPPGSTCAGCNDDELCTPAGAEVECVRFCGQPIFVP